MYNLFISYTAGQWDRGACEYQAGRAITMYTDLAIEEKYKTLDVAAIAELVSLPGLFMYEEGCDDTVRVGWITAIRPRNSSVRIEYEMESTLPALSREALKKISLELDFRGLSTTHWSVKDVELLPALVKGGFISEADLARQPQDSRIIQFGYSRPARQINIRPTVFRIPAAKVEPDLVSAMMPFEMSFAAVYNAIRAACESAALRCQRADDIWYEPEVIQDIFSLIYLSRVVICDFSGRNPNVFYEAGIAHTLGRTVIPIVQNEGDIPFDLRHIRFVKYLDNAEGREALTTTLSEKLRSITGA